MSIPIITKEDIFADKDIQTILNERRIDDAEFDIQITNWLAECVGFVKGAILETYFQYIDEYTWKVIMKMYCKWQSLDMMYSLNEQALVQNAYISLVDYLNRLNQNVTAQASLSVIPNHSSNFFIYNV